MRLKVFLRVLPIFVACSLGTAATSDDATHVTIIFLADSNLNGRGGRSMLKREEEFQPALARALAADGVIVAIESPGWQEFSEDGLSWINRAPAAAKMLAASKGYAVMVEIGGNDCHNPFTLDQTRSNLDQILKRLDEAHIPVLVVGNTPDALCRLSMGSTYVTEYIQMFSDLASKYGDLYYADFMDGANGHPELFQDDQEHANAAGNALIAERMLPVVKKLVAQTEK